MIRDLLKWVAPGLLTVLGGTMAAMAMGSGALVADLTERGTAALAADDLSWAHLSFSARNAELSGTASSAAQRDAAIARIAALAGVHSVSSSVILAPLAAPYHFDVNVEDGRVSLSGAMPNAALRDHFRTWDGVVEADLVIRSGQPDEDLWRQGADFALRQAAWLENGRVGLDGLTLTLDGRAASDRALGELHMALADLPAGLTLGHATIAPMAVAPYTWRADFDGTRIAVSGHVPDIATVERLRLADTGGLPVATGLSLASGAPEHFEALAQDLLEQLARLDRGTASIVDGESLLTGAAPSMQVAQAVTEALSGAGSIVRLDPPPIADYWVSATKQPGGVVVFDGYAPDDATRTALAKVEGADINWLKLGSGAPAIYRSAVDFGTGLFPYLAEGRFALRGNVMTMSGIAASNADYRALRARLDDALPQGIVLAMAEIKAPAAAQYEFAMTRAAGGRVTLSGMLPGPELERHLLDVIGPEATASINYASGEPLNFAAFAEQATHFLPWLQTGEIRFSNGAWTISGTPASEIDKGAIETEFAVRGLVQSGWQIALDVPAPADASPYIFAAERDDDGVVRLSGFVPAAATQHFLAVRAGADAVDTTEIAPGAPEDFARQVLRAMDVLALMDEGKVAFDGEAWSAKGQGGTAYSAAALAEILGDTADTWTLAIAAPQPLQPANAEPEPAIAEAAAPEPVAAEPATPAEPVEPVSAAIEPPAPAPSAEPAAEEPSAPTNFVACQALLRTLSAQNAILFQSGAAVLTASAEPELDAFAAALKRCPQADVNVEGHTDSDGDAKANLALSVARAEAVVNALIARDVSPARLYAIGYGESQPIADNNTAQGKKQNRRIVISLADPAAR